MKRLFMLWLRKRLAKNHFADDIDKLEENIKWLLSGSVFSIPLRLFCLDRELFYTDKADELYRWIIGGRGQ